MPRYEKADREFWEITRKGNVVATRSGRIAGGREQYGHPHLYDHERRSERTFPSPAAARAECAMLAAGRRRDGFRLVDGVEPDAEPPAPTQVNLEIEAAIAAAPDDPMPCLVYADWLQERGDPRGELIALEHAMSEQRDPSAFVEMKKRVESLRVYYATAW